MTVRRLLAVVAWVLLVLVCSTGVWGVIRTAGTGVTTSPEIPSTTTGTAPAAGPATSTAGPHRRSHPSEPSSSSAPSVAPEPRASTGANPSLPPQSVDSSDEHTQGPTELRRTWQGAAGAVVASCRGATIVFGGAQSNSGWKVEVGSRGPEEIEVHFSGSTGDDGGDDGGSGAVELKARCVGGEPHFSTSGD